MRHKHWGVFTDGDGKVVGSATTADGNAGTVSVYLAGTSTAADVYAASSGGAAVSSVSTDTDGYFAFWVDDFDYHPTQRFKVTLSHADFESKDYDNIDVMTERYIVDSTVTDHGSATTEANRSIKDLVDSIGSSVSATMVFPHNGSGNTTAYTISTAETIPSNFDLEVENGAYFNPDSGITLTYEGGTPLHSKWFGALHDAATDDSDALNNMISSVPSGGKVIIDHGITRCNSVDFNKNQMRIICNGQFKPYADSGYCIALGGDGVAVHDISAYGVDIDSGGGWATWTTVVACKIQELYSSEIHFKRIEGCAVGLHLTNSAATGVVYNQFFLGRVYDNEVNIKIDPDNSGWVNENNFYGGRFSHSTGQTYTNCWHIKILDDDVNNPNNNKFYRPSFEGGGDQAFYCAGGFNSVEEARLEMTSYSADTVTFTSDSGENRFSILYSQSLLSVGPAVSGTITTVNAAQFTINADVTPQLSAGQLIAVTLDDATVNVAPVYGASYSDPDTTVRLGIELVDLVMTTNEIDTINTLPISDSGRGNVISLGRTDYAVVSNMGYMRTDEVLQMHHGGMVLRGLSTQIPALSIVPASSGGDVAFAVSDFNGYTITMTGNGDLKFINPANGNTIFEFLAGSYAFKTYDASGNESVRVDGVDSSVTLLLDSDGTGVANNSIFKKTSDGKLYWKDNGGTDQALY